MAANIDEFDDLFLTDEERAAKKRAQEEAKRKKAYDFSDLDDIPPLDDTPPTGEKKNTFDDSFSSLRESLGGSLFGNIDMDKTKKEAAKKWNDLNEKAEGFNKKADEAANNAMDFLTEKGKQAVDGAKDLFDQAKNYAYDLEEKMRKKDEEEEAKLKNQGHKLEDDLLGGYDSFFEKAQSFSDRLEKKVNERFSSDEKVKITNPDSYRDKKKKDSSPTSIHGFEDLDGDGDPIIDDAIIED